MVKLRIIHHLCLVGQYETCGITHMLQWSDVPM